MPISNTIFFKRRTVAAGNVLRGAHRSGVNGKIGAWYSSARVDRPAIMINSIRYVGRNEGEIAADAMTAKSHALYEWLMASARADLAAASEHRVTFEAAKAWLNEARTDRLIEYVEALRNTFVTYDFRIAGYQRIRKMPLLLCECVHDNAIGERWIRYSLHAAVRQVILESRQYAGLEIDAFRNFRCKYSARLYPKLALHAGMDAEVGKTIDFLPQELAEFVGWTGAWHMGNFQNRVLKPVMKDLKRIERFQASWSIVVKADPKDPANPEKLRKYISFTVTHASKDLGEELLARTSKVELSRVRKQQSGEMNALMPNTMILLKAAQRTGILPTLLNDAWEKTIRVARFDDGPISDSVLEGRRLLSTIEHHGIEAGFKAWVEATGGIAPPEDMVRASLAEMPPAVIERKSRLKDTLRSMADKLSALGSSRTPEQRMEYTKLQIRLYGCGIVEKARNRAETGPTPDEVLRQWVDPAFDHFNALAEFIGGNFSQTNYKVVLEAATLLSKEGDTDRLRKSVNNLGHAIGDWNLLKLGQVAYSILVAGIKMDITTAAFTADLPRYGELDYMLMANATYFDSSNSE